ncbi:tetratricopeptide repeat protein [Escherichia coli]|nr:tetratricopeptide repeat protein [Escherichia coli]ELM8135320.1 tetratricopeptide repeat protein [Escherichia coli]ELM8159722.1 tetratricopeptide repeat protein [Escherichia coli]EMF1465848.1 tetratricopeptide repeat protein [Escherichia coli]HBJ6091945.1 tetratricopeptide repeat protein [Escherichia coli]
MNCLDDLPKRDQNHVHDTMAKTAFEAFIASSGVVLKQSSDDNDYGTDYQLEIMHDGMATNVRLQVQLKGTAAGFNTDGSVSISVKRSNLNYLLMSPGSLYVCLHIPTNTLKVTSAQSVLTRYQNMGPSWQSQKSVTVNFAEDLTIQHLIKITSLARLSALDVRNRRVAHRKMNENDMVDHVRELLTVYEVADDTASAVHQLINLYKSNQTEVISAAYERFKTVLGEEHPAMMFCYMAEIDLASANKIFDRQRVELGILKLKAYSLADGADRAGLHYSIGNGFAALNDFNEALEEYKIACELNNQNSDNELMAMIIKNMGGTYAALENENQAVECYLQALKNNPYLAEAHYALGLYYHNTGQFEKALEQLDKIVFSSDTQGNLIDLQGWRISALFNVGEGRSAFREINALLSQADKAQWIWPWCLKIVSQFGRESIENAKLSLTFWESALRHSPENPLAQRELLLAIIYLRNRNIIVHKTYLQFKNDLEACANKIGSDAASVLWDLLGHWAEDEELADEAILCFEKAYSLQKGDYGLCLSIALNKKHRYEESKNLMKIYTLAFPNDDQGWYRLASTYDLMGQLEKCIEPYLHSLSLNVDNDHAWFNLGGAFFNMGNYPEARRVWKEAVSRFPDHELTAKIRADIPFILTDEPLQ